MFLQIPALRDCLVTHFKCIKTQPNFGGFHNEIAKDIWRLYLLLLWPFFTFSIEHTRLSMRDDTPMLSDKYSQITDTLLSFLLSGTRTSSLVSKSRFLDQRSNLLEKLAIRILNATLAETSYSASFIVQLTQLFVRTARTVREDSFLASSIQHLAPIIVNYCIVRLTGFLTSS